MQPQYLFIIYYHNGNEYDFDHLVSTDEISAKKTFLKTMKEQDMTVETIQGVYILTKSWDDNGDEYQINIHNTHNM